MKGQSQNRHKTQQYRYSESYRSSFTFATAMVTITHKFPQVFSGLHSIHLLDDFWPKRSTHPV